jgi:hypothetical protein
MKKIIDRTVVLELDLEKTAKDFGYKLDADSFDDVWHQGYKSSDIRKSNLDLPKGYENLNKFFPEIVAICLEDAERDAVALAIGKFNLRAFESCLLKIDVGASAEYRTADGEDITAKAAITDVEVDLSKNILKVTILNPEHLINTMLHGFGAIWPDLSPYEEASNNDLISRFHNLKDFFSIYGESMPSGELPSQYSESIDEDSLKQMLQDRLSELTQDEIADAVFKYVQNANQKISISEFCKYNGIQFSAEDVSMHIVVNTKQEKQKELENLFNLIVD